MTHFLRVVTTIYCVEQNTSFNLWWQKRVLTQTLKPLLFRFLNVAAEAATHKDDLWDTFRARFRRFVGCAFRHDRMARLSEGF
jgi:hypothetical protein